MKFRVIFVTAFVGILTLISCQKNINTARLSSEIDTISYYIGLSIGSNLKESPLKDINYLALAKGLKDAQDNDELEYDPYEINMKITSYMEKLESSQSQSNLLEGEAFLEKNKNRTDVTTLESGLQYRIIREGSGPKPILTDNVTVHYHGTLIDGTVFDSSVDRGEPVTFPLNGVIQGWQEALQLMPVGSKWEIFIPTGLAYGENTAPGGPIKPNMALIFEVELLSIDE